MHRRDAEGLMKTFAVVVYIFAWISLLK